MAARTEAEQFDIITKANYYTPCSTSFIYIFFNYYFWALYVSCYIITVGVFTQIFLYVLYTLSYVSLQSTSAKLL